ncbi:MAG: DUF4160 domain-containing protein [Thermoanaerobaculia bacterium]
MTPTVFRKGPYRFFFFSRDETRVHVHVESADGEVKFWLEPEVEVARNYRLTENDLTKIRKLILEHEKEIRDAWNGHFGS